MPDCFIFDCLRTPRGRGRPEGALHGVTSLELVRQVLAGLAARNALDTSAVDDVVLGCVDPVGEAGGNIARAAVLAAGFDQSVAGMQVNRFCASGLDAVNIAAAQIIAGAQDMAIAGGVESMSRVGLGASGGAWPSDPSLALDSHYVPQGISADLIATRYGFSREDVDDYALESQRRAAAAWNASAFAGTILPVVDALGLPLLSHDEHMRPETTRDQLAGLAPAFARTGDEQGYDAVAIQRYPELEYISHVHTAGNSSGIVDGAAAVLLASRAAGRAQGLKPRARIRAFASIGSEPTIMLTGPEAVAAKVLKRAGMSKRDIDLHEVNEAFAAVVLRYMQALSLDHGRVNVFGGAIAMGHPLGATGAMILGTALDALEQRGLGTALVTLCIGAGMGTATVIERL